MSRYTTEPYRAEGGFSVTGLPVLLVIMVAVAGAMGWLASFVRQWFYLVLVFPAGIGLVLFFTGMAAGKLTRMRSPLMAGLIALIASAVAMVAMHYFDYQRFLEKIAPADPEVRAK